MSIIIVHVQYRKYAYGIGKLYTQNFVNNLNTLYVQIEHTAASTFPATMYIENTTMQAACTLYTVHCSKGHGTTKLYVVIYVPLVPFYG